MYSNGSKWCSRYPPEKLEYSFDVHDNRADQAEDQETIRLLKKYGINQVRGGNFVISRDVDRLPGWLPRSYRENEHEIMGATLAGRETTRCDNETSIDQ